MRFRPPSTGDRELDFFLLELARAFESKTGLLQEEADGLYDGLGAADAAVDAHEAASNPHPQYLKKGQLKGLHMLREDDGEHHHYSIGRAVASGTVVGSGNIDGGDPDENYTSTAPIDGGTP